MQSKESIGIAMKEKVQLDYLSYTLSRMKGGSRFDLIRHNTGIKV